MNNDTEQFLRKILPHSGHYCIAWQSSDRGGMPHEFFTDVTAMAARIGELEKQQRTVYFAPASFSEAKRRQGWVHALKSLWFDIDCGEDKAESGQGYATQSDAAKQLFSWLNTNNLPVPTIVSSGHGLHVYWCLPETIAPSDWKKCAEQLKQLAAIGPQLLLVDHSRTTDSASLMRPVGTCNRKRGKPVKGVGVTYNASPVGFVEFRQLVIAAIGDLMPPAESQGISAAVPAVTASPSSTLLDDLRSGSS